MRLQRRNQRWHDRGAVLREIKKEYAAFKYGVLMGTVHEAYDSCRQICFYENLHEYFLYGGHISRAFIEAVAGKGGILGELWEIYLKNENLRADTWEEIETMLQEYTERHMPQERMEV